MPPARPNVDDPHRERLPRLPHVAIGVAVLLCGHACRTEPGPQAPSSRAPSSPRVYVTNEASGDLSVIDTATNSVTATVRLGKPPRGVQADLARGRLYVAVSGSPFAGPDRDPADLPPPDRNADGIAVVDLRENRLVKVLAAGPDPEQF